MQNKIQNISRQQAVSVELILALYLLSITLTVLATFLIMRILRDTTHSSIDM